MQIWLEKRARGGKSGISGGQNLASSNFVDIREWVGGRSLFFFLNRLLVTLTDWWDRQRMKWNKACEATFKAKADSRTSQTTGFLSCVRHNPSSSAECKNDRKAGRGNGCFAVSQTSFSCEHGLRFAERLLQSSSHAQCCSHLPCECAQFVRKHCY